MMQKTFLVCGIVVAGALAACGSNGSNDGGTEQPQDVVTTTGDARQPTTDGSVTVTTPDGAVVTITPDGAVVMTTPDGAVVTTDPDGAVVVVTPPDGGTVTSPDGAVVNPTDGGAGNDATVTNPTDGGVIQTPDGAIGTGGDPDGFNPGSTDAGAQAFQALAPCNNESDYVAPAADAGTPAITITSGPSYTPRCLVIHRGDRVTFPSSNTHPLAKSTRGTAANPIPMTLNTDELMTLTATFETAGFFPYYCQHHGSNDGTGMSGVVRVLP